MRFIAFLIAILGLMPAAAFAQSNGKNASPAARPFGIGERLTYHGELSKIIRGIDLGDMSFVIAPNSTSSGFVIKSEAKSRGSLLAILRFSFLQKYESFVESETFRADRTVKYDEQKDRVRESDTVFDYSNQTVTFTERNPKNPTGAPRKIASGIKGDTHDIITGIYALRTMPLSVGSTFEVPVSDSGLVYSIPVRVTAKEIQKTALGKLLCFRVEPEVFGHDRFIEEKGQMVIWITDDERRIPVRSEIKTGFGRIDIKIKSFEAAK